MAVRKEKLKPVMVRFSKEEYDAIVKSSRKHNKSMSEICRLLMSNHYPEDQDTIRFIDEKQGKEVLLLISKVCTELQRIRTEINRIGVNYNQDVRYRNAAAKNGRYGQTGAENLTIEDLNYMNELLQDYKKLLIKTGEVLSYYV